MKSTDSMNNVNSTNAGDEQSPSSSSSIVADSNNNNNDTIGASATNTNSTNETGKTNNNNNNNIISGPFNYDELTLPRIHKLLEKKDWTMMDLTPEEHRDYGSATRINRWRRKTLKMSQQEILNWIKKGNLIDAKVKKEKELLEDSKKAELQPLTSHVPFDIIVHVSSFLSGRDISSTLSMVSTSWRNALETDEMWEQRFRNEFTDKDADSLPKVYGWKQKYVMVSSYMYSKCSFCFSKLQAFRVNSDNYWSYGGTSEWEDYQPIADLKVLACAECKKANLMAKTNLKKKYCVNDKEIRQLTSYHPKGDGRKVIYFMTEFMALMDERDQDIDGTIQNRMDKRDSYAKSFFKRMVTTDMKERSALEEMLIKELGMSREKARDVALRRSGNIKGNMEHIVQKYRYKKAAIDKFTKLAGRRPTFEERGVLKELRPSLDDNDDLYDDQLIKRFWRKIQRRELFESTMNKSLSKMCKGRYSRYQDLPAVCFREIDLFIDGLDNNRDVVPYVDLYGTPSNVEEINQSGLNTAVEAKIKEIKGKLDREEKVKKLIEDAGFNYGPLYSNLEQRSSTMSSYISGQSTISAAEVAKELLLSYTNMDPGRLIMGIEALPKREKRRFIRQFVKELLVENDDSTTVLEKDNASALSYLRNQYSTISNRSILPSFASDRDGRHMEQEDRSSVISAMFNDFMMHDPYTYGYFSERMPTSSAMKETLHDILHEYYVTCETADDEATKTKTETKSKVAGRSSKAKSGRKGKKKVSEKEELMENDGNELDGDTAAITVSSPTRTRRGRKRTRAMQSEEDKESTNKEQCTSSASASNQ